MLPHAVYLFFLTHSNSCITALFCSASAATLKETAAGLCQDVQDVLGTLTVLPQLVDQFGDFEIPTTGGIPGIAVPTDEAFDALLDTLDTTLEALEADLVQKVLSLHVGLAADAQATTATTVAGEQMKFFIDGEPSALINFVDSIGNSSTIIATDQSEANATAAVQCLSGETAILIDTVLLPGDSAEAPSPMPEPIPPSETTLKISEAVENLCDPISTALKDVDFSTLSAALEAAGDVEITLPDGELVIAAPNNEAFNAALTQLGLTPAELLNQPQRLQSILALHLAVAQSLNSTSAATISGAEMTFNINGAVSSVNEVAAVARNNTATVKAGAFPSNVVDVISCGAEGQTAFVVESVLLPEEIAAEIAAGSEDETAEGPAEDQVVAEPPAPEMEDGADDDSGTMMDSPSGGSSSVTRHLSVLATVLMLMAHLIA